MHGHDVRYIGKARSSGALSLLPIVPSMGSGYGAGSGDASSNTIQGLVLSWYRAPCIWLLGEAVWL